MEEEIEILENKIKVIKECYKEIIKMKDEQLEEAYKEIAELSYKVGRKD